MRFEDRCKLEGVELPKKKECEYRVKQFDGGWMECGDCPNCTYNKAKEEYDNLEVSEPRDLRAENEGLKALLTMKREEIEELKGTLDRAHKIFGVESDKLKKVKVDEGKIEDTK